MTGKPGQPHRHPASVTNDRLLDAYERWFDKLSGPERNAIGIVRNALHRIADEAASAHCGTESAYHRHIRDGEPADEACKAAHAAALKAWRRTDVKPNQIWADNNPRSAGRTLRVDRIEGTKAVCTVLTNTDEVQERVDGTYQQETFRAGASAPRGMYPSDRRGKEARISLARFKPTSSGYRLVED